VLAQGAAIGAHKVDRFPTVTVWKMRLTITQAEPYAAIAKFGVYNVK
jgi:alpha-L-fucosidase